MVNSPSPFLRSLRRGASPLGLNGGNPPSGSALLTKVAHGGNPQDRTFALFSSRGTRPTKVLHRNATSRYFPSSLQLSLENRNLKREVLPTHLYVNYYSMLILFAYLGNLRLKRFIKALNY